MVMMYKIAIFNDLLKEKSLWANRENIDEAVKIYHFNFNSLFKN